MGTSLKVYPIKSLPEEIDQNTPVCIINRENPGLEGRNVCFLGEDLDKNVENLMSDLGWEIPVIKKKKIKK